MGVGIEDGMGWALADDEEKIDEGGARVYEPTVGRELRIFLAHWPRDQIGNRQSIEKE